MTSALVFAIERFDDVVPVLRVDAQQGEQHKANGPAFGGNARLHLAPQAVVDRTQRVFLHDAVSSPRPHRRSAADLKFLDQQTPTRPPADRQRAVA